MLEKYAVGCGGAWNHRLGLWDRVLIKDNHLAAAGAAAGEQLAASVRRARAAAVSQIPTTTGAAKAGGLVIPELKGRIDGFSVRVPTPDVSIVDFVAVLKKTATAEEINAAFKAAEAGSLKGILGTTDLPLVSCDFLGDSRSGIVDLLSTKVVDGTLAKVIAWYDNEWGYSCRLVDLAKYVAK